MMCYTLGKANSTCLGERQLRGRIASASENEAGAIFLCFFEIGV